MEGLLVIGVLMAAVLAVVGYWIAEEKRRDGVEGAVLGCLLGPFGLLIEAVLPTGEVRSAPVATSTTSTPRSGPEPPRAEYYAWQALYVPYDFVAGPEDSREPAGPDGPPPGWAKFDAKTPTANLIAAMAGAERHYSGELGFRVVEAVWQPGTRPTILAAFGDPAKTYDLLWPEYPRVRWTSRVGTEGGWEANGPTDVPELIAPTRAASGPSEAASEDKPGSAGSSASVAPEERRPTKTCPDCAETILEPARICRFCRYEFWPADALPSGPPSDEPDTADEVSVRTHVEEAGDVAEADAGEQAPVPTEAQTVVPEQGAPQPQPGPPAAVQQPAATEPEVEPEAVEVPPPAAPPPLPSYAPPPPSYLPPSTAPPPSGWPAPPSYAPQQPPYTPPPPAWQPPPQGPPPPSQGPWAPPPPRPPDRPRE